MPQPAGTSLVEHFAALEDPRQAAKVLYPVPVHNFETPLCT
jgi:hypothetical protein